MRLITSTLLTSTITLASASLQHMQPFPKFHPLQTFASTEAFRVVTPSTVKHTSITGDQSHEQYDPVSGNLKLVYNDIVLPGDGKLPIVIRRLFDHFNPAGRDFLTPMYLISHSRWDVGMNIPILLAPSDTSQAHNNTDFLTNVALRLPNGNIEKLVIKKINPGVNLVTASNWKVYLEYHAPKLTYWVTSPTGTVYYYEEPVSGDGYVGFQSGAHIQSIQDKHGNRINFTYSNNLLTQIKASDGRQVGFSYAQNSRGQVITVTANNQAWKYYFDKINLPKHVYTYQLTQVVRPDGKAWHYAYNTESGINLSIVTSPLGLKTIYKFGNQNGVSAVLPFYVNNPLMRKEIILSEKTHYDWNYLYNIGNNDANHGETTIQGPTNTSIYKYLVAFLGSDFKGHLGYALQYFGLIDQIQLYNKLGRLKQTENFDYMSLPSRRIAVTSPQYSFCVNDHLNKGDASRHCSYVFDAALLAKHEVIIPDQGTYTTQFSQYDSFGRPHHIQESGDNNQTRVIDLTYFTNLHQNIYGDIQSKKINNQVNVTNEFDENNLGDIITHTENGITTRYSYYKNGNLKSKTDANNHTTAFTEYSYGIAGHTSYPNNSSTSQQINPTGTIATSFDANGHKTGYDYDSLNRVVSITDALKHTSTTHYDTQESGAGGHTTTQGNLKIITRVDKLGRETEVDKVDLSTGVLYRQRKRYDGNNNLIFKSYWFNPKQGDSSAGYYYHYDAQNRLTLTCAPDPNQYCTKISFQPGHKVITTNANDKSTISTFQSYGNPKAALLIKTEQPEGITTLIHRDARGLVQAISQGKLTREYSYDPITLQLQTMTDPENGTTQFSYDKAGNLVRKTISGLVTKYTYDATNRIKFIDYSDGSPTLLKTYYPNGQIKTISKNNIKQHYSYDANNNLTAEQVQIGGNNYELHYSYDQHNVLQQIIYPDNRVVNYAPDAFGRATQVGNYLRAIEYYPTGAIKSYTYANGAEVNHSLNQRLLPSMIRLNTPSASIERTYGYDNTGNITQVDSAEDPTYNLTLNYDAVNRLIAASGKWGKGSIRYNRNGDILHKHIGNSDLNYTMDDSGKLTSVSGSTHKEFSYDALGNVTSNGTLQFQYRLDGNLTQIKNTKGQVLATYQYDGFGHRLVSTHAGATEFSFYNQAGTLMFAQNNHAQTDYLYLNGNKIAQLENTDADNQVTYFFNNLLGSPIAAIDQAGALLWVAHYQPFGVRLDKISHSHNTQWYTGKVEDKTTGLLYYGARYYDPEIGRFMAMDPVGFDLANPITFNRYAYAANNPFLYTDPTGMWSVEIGWNNGNWALGVSTSYGFIGFSQAVFDNYAKISNDFWNTVTLGWVGEDVANDHNFSLDLSVTGGYGRSATYGASLNRRGISFYNAYGYGCGFNMSLGMSITAGNAPTGFTGAFTVANGRFFNLGSTTGLSQNGAYETISAGVGAGFYAGSIVGYNTKTYAWKTIGDGIVNFVKHMATPH